MKLVGSPICKQSELSIDFDFQNPKALQTAFKDALH